MSEVETVIITEESVETLTITHDHEITITEPETETIIVTETETVTIPIESVEVVSVGIPGVPGRDGIDGDKTFSQTFAPESTVFVNHLLNKYPAVSVINTAGDEVEGDVNYIDTNSLLVSFTAPFGGIITCN